MCNDKIRINHKIANFRIKFIMIDRLQLIQKFKCDLACAVKSDNSDYPNWNRIYKNLHYEFHSLKDYEITKLIFEVCEMVKKYVVIDCEYHSNMLYIIIGAIKLHPYKYHKYTELIKKYSHICKYTDRYMREMKYNDEPLHAKLLENINDHEMTTLFKRFNDADLIDFIQKSINKDNIFRIINVLKKIQKVIILHDIELSDNA